MGLLVPTWQGQGQGNGKGKPLPDSLDDHSGWGEVDQETKAMAEERLKDAIRKATEEVNSGGRGWGSVSQGMRKKIQDMVSPKVNWRSVLRYFIKTSQRANKRSTPRRINKRFPYIHSGKRVNRTAKIAISIDQSGSVSDDMLAAFFAELFSTEVRYSGASLGYQIGAIVGGSFAPTIATLLWKNYDIFWVSAYIAFASLLSLISVYFLTETYQKDLNE